MPHDSHTIQEMQTTVTKIRDSTETSHCWGNGYGHCLDCGWRRCVETQTSIPLGVSIGTATLRSNRWTWSNSKPGHRLQSQAANYGARLSCYEWSCTRTATHTGCHWPGYGCFQVVRRVEKLQQSAWLMSLKCLLSGPLQERFVKRYWLLQARNHYEGAHRKHCL